MGDTYIFSGTDTDKTPINENLINIDYNKFVAESDKKGFVISYQGQTFKNDSTDTSGNTFVASNGEKMIVDQLQIRLLINIRKHLNIAMEKREILKKS